MVMSLGSLFERTRKWVNKEGENKDSLFVLDEDKIREILCIDDEHVVETTYEIVKILMERLKDTTATIDSKATSLFGMVSISVSLITYFASTVIKEINMGLLFYCLIVLFIAVIFLMLVSNLFSLRSFRARSDWKEISDQHIFQEEVIKEKAIVYKRFLITAFWKIYVNNYGINEKKGKELKCAQKFLQWALYLLLPTFVLLTVKYIELKGGW